MQSTLLRIESVGVPGRLYFVGNACRKTGGEYLAGTPFEVCDGIRALAPGGSEPERIRATPENVLDLFLSLQRALASEPDRVADALFEVWPPAIPDWRILAAHRVRYSPDRPRFYHATTFDVATFPPKGGEWREVPDWADGTLASTMVLLARETPSHKDTALGRMQIYHSVETLLLHRAKIIPSSLGIGHEGYTALGFCGIVGKYMEDDAFGTKRELFRLFRFLDQAVVGRWMLKASVAEARQHALPPRRRRSVGCAVGG